MALPKFSHREDLRVPLIHPRSIALSGDASTFHRASLVAALALAMMVAANGLAGASQTDDAGQSVSTGAGAGSATSQSTRPESVAERVVVKVRRLDLTRLPATEFGDGEPPGPDNRDQMP